MSMNEMGPWQLLFSLIGFYLLAFVYGSEVQTEIKSNDQETFSKSLSELQHITEERKGRRKRLIFEVMKPEEPRSRRNAVGDVISDGIASKEVVDREESLEKKDTPRASGRAKSLRPVTDGGDPNEATLRASKGNQQTRSIERGKRRSHVITRGKRGRTSAYGRSLANGSSSAYGRGGGTYRAAVHFRSGEPTFQYDEDDMYMEEESPLPQQQEYGFLLDRFGGRFPGNIARKIDK